MYVVAVNVFVKPESVDAFRAAILDNARNSRREPGNLQFDVSQGEDDPTRFFLYEVYRTKADFAYHQQQPHFFRWRDAVADMMAQPRQRQRFNTVFYRDGEGDVGSGT